MLRSIKTALVSAVLVLGTIAGGHASAQQRTSSETEQSLAMHEALSGVMSTDQFQYAERNNDLTTMRELLAPYGLGVAGNEPQLHLTCKPPYGYPVWAWINYHGTWMYGWVCVRASVQPIEPPIKYVD
jgi:hypothetical protein